MLLMVCTRCHAHAAMRSPSPEALGGAAWPFPDGICSRCLARVLKDDPAARARLFEFQKVLNKKMLAGAPGTRPARAPPTINRGGLLAERVSRKLPPRRPPYCLRQ